MGGWNLIHLVSFIHLSVLLLSETCLAASVRNFGKISPGFQGAQQNWIDNDGLFLLSNQSDFAFGFVTTSQDVTLFLLCIVHMDSRNIVWTANRGSPVSNSNSDKWIFKKTNEECLLDWEKRFNIAVGTAKGLAYLHEHCDSKIIHCDIKPQNVLLDNNYHAKVADFGLAKLMTKEQSHVFTTLRGTRGYLAPEWITNRAISEKSDVYSYGMLLLEIIGGRKNYDQSESSEKSQFPSYAFKMLKEGKMKDIVDSKLKIDNADERVSTAIIVALWCIQQDMSLRPSMAKVVKIFEGVCPVPQPPTSSAMISSTMTSSGPTCCNSDAYLSAEHLSGPR